MPNTAGAAGTGAEVATAERFRPAGLDFAAFRPRHFLWQLDGKVATVTLDRPERKNPLTMESYAELRDTFRNLVYADAVKGRQAHHRQSHGSVERPVPA